MEKVIAKIVVLEETEDSEGFDILKKHLFEVHGFVESITPIDDADPYSDAKFIVGKVSEDVKIFKDGEEIDLEALQQAMRDTSYAEEEVIKSKNGLMLHIETAARDGQDMPRHASTGCRANIRNLETEYL